MPTALYNFQSGFYATLLAARSDTESEVEGTQDEVSIWQQIFADDTLAHELLRLCRADRAHCRVSITPALIGQNLQGSSRTTNCKVLLLLPDPGKDSAEFLSRIVNSMHKHSYNNSSLEFEASKISLAVHMVHPMLYPQERLRVLETWSIFSDEVGDLSTNIWYYGERSLEKLHSADIGGILGSDRQSPAVDSLCSIRLRSPCGGAAYLILESPESSSIRQSILRSLHEIFHTDAHGRRWVTGWRHEYRQNGHHFGMRGPAGGAGNSYSLHGTGDSNSDSNYYDQIPSDSDDDSAYHSYGYYSATTGGTDDDDSIEDSDYQDESSSDDDTSSDDDLYSSSDD